VRERKNERNREIEGENMRASQKQVRMREMGQRKRNIGTG
jgi:hypothetical protein